MNTRRNKKSLKYILIKTWPERVIHKPLLNIDVKKTPIIPKPSRDLLFCILFGLMGFIIAGGLYNLVINPPYVMYENNNGYIIPIFFWEDLHEQFVLEGIGFSLVIMIGFIGTYFIYYSSKSFYRANHAQKILLIGIILLIISFILADLMIAQKLNEGVYFYDPQIF